MEEFIKRREKLLENLNEGEAIVIFSGKEIMKSEDESYPFSVNRNFYYLTGIDKANMILLMAKVNGRASSTMFIEPFDEVMARWVGPKMKEDEVKEVSGVDRVMYLDSFKKHINSLYNLERYNGLCIYLDLWHYVYDQNKTEADKFADYINETYHNVKIKDIHDQIASMRMIKDEIEVEKISKAIAITKSGIETMMRAIRPNMNEMVIDKVFDFAIANEGCQLNAFKTIAAGGKNATTLHYSENKEVLKNGDLFLCDLGATYDYYCADISRTFPVNGKFTNRQKEIYDVVLGAQRLVEANARPGISIRDLNNMVIEYYKELLPSLGLFKDISEYYFHGIGHHLGLDTHDITTQSKTLLEPGMVITNEPGLYISDEGIGIRIEDDLLITEDACINLAKDLLHTTEEIEEFMKR